MDVHSCCPFLCRLPSVPSSVSPLYSFKSSCPPSNILSSCLSTSSSSSSSPLLLLSANFSHMTSVCFIPSSLYSSQYRLHFFLTGFCASVRSWCSSGQCSRMCFMSWIPLPHAHPGSALFPTVWRYLLKRQCPVRSLPIITGLHLSYSFHS